LAEESSRELLLHHWESLKKGELPPATELHLKPLAGSVVISTPVAPDEPPTEPAEGQADPPVGLASPSDLKSRLPFRTNDFGGRLAERGDTAQPQVSKEFHRWLEQADCLLFFLAVDQLQDPVEAQERLLEVDALLSRLVEKSPTGHAISQPIAVLITKWDLASDLTGSSEEEREKVLRFLSNQAGQVGQAVCEKIKTVGQQVAVFPVSSFGGHVDGRPICPLKPFNLHEPLVWALRQTDRCLFEKAQREADEALRNPFWKEYRRAIGAYKRLIDDYGINQGPIYKQIQAQLIPLEKARRRRAVRLLALCAVLLAGAMGYGSYRLDRSRFIDMVARLETPRDPYSSLEEGVTDYLKSFNPWAAVLGHKGHVQDVWAQYQEAFQRQSRDLELDRSKPLPGELRERLEHLHWFRGRCEDFLSKYPQSPNEPQVNQWRNDAEHEFKGLEFAQHVESLIAQWPESAKPSEQSFGKAQDLLSQAQQLAAQARGLPRTPDVTTATTKLDVLIRDLKAFLGDVQAQCEQYVSQINGCLQRVETALKEQPADLDKLRKLQQDAESLHNQSAPDPANEKANEAKEKLERQLASFRGTVEKLQRDVQEWKAKAETANASAERALDPAAEDTTPLKEALKELQGLLKETENLPIAPGIDERSRQMRELAANVEGEAKRHDDFDKALKDLKDGIQNQGTEEQRKSLLAFLTRYPENEYPRRRNQLAQLGSRLQMMGGEIDKTRWEAVNKKFEELRDLAESLRAGKTGVSEVQRAYDDFLRAAEDYQRGTDPAPQHTQDVERLEAQALGLLDDAEWKDISEFARNNDKDFEAIAERSKKYLDGNDRIKADQKKHKEEAEKRIRQALADRWKELYQAFYERASAVDTTDKLREAKQNAKKVADWVERHHTDPFAPAGLSERQKKVTDWLNWAEKLLSDEVKEATITIQSIDAKQIAANHNVRLHIWLDQEVWREAEFAPPLREPAVTHTFKIEDFRKNHEIQVQLEVNGFINKSLYYSDPLNTNVFELFSKGRGRIRIVDKANEKEPKEATVILSCPDLTPPALDRPD
jgi:hypothetical protein